MGLFIDVIDNIVSVEMRVKGEDGEMMSVDVNNET